MLDVLELNHGFLGTVGLNLRHVLLLTLFVSDSVTHVLLTSCFGGTLQYKSQAGQKCIRFQYNSYAYPPRLGGVVRGRCYGCFGVLANLVLTDA